MPDPKLTYEILPPSTIVEASLSPEPDDDSEVDITIQAVAPAGGATIKSIRFVLPVPSANAANPRVDDDIDRGRPFTDSPNKREGCLTSKPAKIQPVTKESNAWSITALPDAEGDGRFAFEAKPIGRDQITVSEGQKLTFRLLDVVIIDEEGVSSIRVKETLPDSTVAEQKLAIRKTPPALRIDSLGASALVVTSADAANGVELRWATTGASQVFLEGLSDSDRDLFIATFPGPPGSSPGDNSLSADLHDARFTVHPRITTTYSLRARSKRSAAEVVGQLTITVLTNNIRLASKQVTLSTSGFRSLVDQPNGNESLDDFPVDDSRFIAARGVKIEAFRLGEGELLLGHWFSPASGFKSIGDSIARLRTRTAVRVAGHAEEPDNAVFLSVSPIGFKVARQVRIDPPPSTSTFLITTIPEFSFDVVIFALIAQV
jgi:hypothetical protein